MKKYWKEIMVLIAQVALFYILPLSAGPTDTLGLVVLIILGTFLLSLALGLISKQKIKYIYPVIVAVVFIPSILIYYNSTALIHSVWYLVVSALGLVIGSILRSLICRK